MDETIGVLARITEQGLIGEISSTAHRQIEEGWREIDRGQGDRYRHAQGNYLPDGLFTGDGIHKWMTAQTAMHSGREPVVSYDFGGERWGVYLRNPEEMEADRQEPETDTTTTTMEARMQSMETKAGEFEEALDLLLSGVTE